jgi:hypothetical protein
MRIVGSHFFSWAKVAEGRHQAAQGAQAAPLEQFAAIDTGTEDAAEQRVVFDCQPVVLDAVAVLFVIEVRRLGRMVIADDLKVAKYAHARSSSCGVVVSWPSCGQACCETLLDSSSASSAGAPGTCAALWKASISLAAHGLHRWILALTGIVERNFKFVDDLARSPPP